MDKETARKYLQDGIKATDSIYRASLKLFVINIIFFAISIAVYRDIFFIACCIAAIIADSVIIIVFKVKWAGTIGFLSQGFHLLAFVIALDFMCFAAYKRSNLFVWYEYIVSISIQCISAIVSLLIIISQTKHYCDPKRGLRRASVAGGVAGASCMMTTILCKIFLTNASLSVVLTIISSLINILICILMYVIVLAFYRAYLMRKWKFRDDFSSE